MGRVLREWLRGEAEYSVRAMHQYRPTVGYPPGDATSEVVPYAHRDIKPA